MGHGCRCDILTLPVVGTAVVTGNVSDEVLKSAVTAQGYEVTGIDKAQKPCILLSATRLYHSENIREDDDPAEDEHYQHTDFSGFFNTQRRDIAKPHDKLKRGVRIGERCTERL